MRHWIIAGVMAVMLCWGSQTVSAAPNVSEDVYQWIQSTARANYYFNKQQICFAVDKDGYIDLDTLIVPTLRTYDDVQIKDVVDKRRWKMASVDGYSDLVGEAEYLKIQRSKRIVSVEETDDLDSTWSTLTAEYPKQEIELDKLAAKNVDRVFYEAILTYAEKHQDEIIKQTKGTLRPAADAQKGHNRKRKV